MTEIDIQKLIKFLKDKWGSVECPLCHSNRWTVQNRVFELREFHRGGMVIGSGPIVPVVPITCENCGNTVLVNAIIAGVVEAAKPDAVDAAQGVSDD